MIITVCFVSKEVVIICAYLKYYLLLISG